MQTTLTLSGEPVNLLAALFYLAALVGNIVLFTVALYRLRGSVNPKRPRHGLDRRLLPPVGNASPEYQD